MSWNLALPPLLEPSTTPSLPLSVMSMVTNLQGRAADHGLIFTVWFLASTFWGLKNKCGDIYVYKIDTWSIQRWGWKHYLFTWPFFYSRCSVTILPFLDFKISKISSNVWKAAHDDGWWAGRDNNRLAWIANNLFWQPMFTTRTRTDPAQPRPNNNNPRCLTHPPTNNPTMTPSQRTHRAWWAPT